MNTDYDAVIIGSGPGGSTVAKELSEQGKHVAILERGGKPGLKGSFIQYLLYQLIPFKSLLFTDGFVGIVRGLLTGGSSIFYYATCFEVPVDMLKTYGIDVTKEVAEAKKELPVAPLKDEMMTPMSELIMGSARKFGYKWEKLDKIMYQDQWKPGMKFGYYGDPYGIKWSARMYLNEAVANGADLITGAKVKRVIVENGKAAGVEYRQGLRKKKFYSNTIVLAAGGIGSPVIMRNSGVKKAGYDFFYDPLITVCGKVKNVRAGTEIPMSAGVHLKDREYMMTDMSVPPALDAVFSAMVFRFHRLFSQKKTLRIMVKIKDSLGGRITNCGQVRKNYPKKIKRNSVTDMPEPKRFWKKQALREFLKPGI